jgi:hypothetical protein
VEYELFAVEDADQGAAPQPPSVSNPVKEVTQTVVEADVGDPAYLPPSGALALQLRFWFRTT